MKYIFYLTGKSASGKDSIYKKLLEEKKLGLYPVLLCTTRPKREGEEEGREYHFVDEDYYSSAEKNGEVIECRTYDTIHGPWRYFTLTSSVDEGNDYYLGIGTLESCIKLSRYFGKDRVVPIYISVEDGERLKRAIGREQNSGKPDYKEMCRRFLADTEDFSDEKLKSAGITSENIFENTELSVCIENIRRTISGYQGK
ncbi:MAG: guanylate kinase [Lachnospiraceae bacterium]|nr:guanylate kinase [Lachnospiraceae bacterium]